MKPNKLAADLRTVFEDAMAYVMLSRVQAIEQLFIVGSLPENKFRVSFRCLEELDRLKKEVCQCKQTNVGGETGRGYQNIHSQLSIIDR